MQANLFLKYWMCRRRTREDASMSSGSGRRRGGSARRE